MRRASLLILLVFTAPAFAGCLGGDASAGDIDPATADVATNGTTTGGTIPVDGGRGASAADLGHSPHLHDYWLGRERVTLFEDTIEPSMDETMNATFYRMFFQKQPMVGGTGFNLPDGTIVYEGSGELAVTATWTDPAVTSLGFSYKSAASGEFSNVIKLVNGETFSVPVTPEMTDMPHTTTSRWGFVFSPAEPGAVAGAFDLKMELVKVRDIGLFPGHPDVFGNESSLVIHEGSHEFTEVSYPRRTPQLILTGEFGETEVTPKGIIPMDTQWIVATVHITKAEATPGEIVGLKFFYHGSDRSFIDYPFLRPIEGSFEEGHLVYAFPVTMNEADSPYAKESQWRFFVEPQTSFTGMDGASGGTQDTTFGFNFEIVAFNEPQDMEESKKVQRGEG